MDILHLVERLEKTLNESRRLPLTANLLVDEDRIYNMIDQMRLAIPEEIKRAQRIGAERDRIIAHAQEEATRIRELARQEAHDLVHRDSVVLNARRKADNIIDIANRAADQVRYGADQYALQVLAHTESDMSKALGIIRNGLSSLQQNMAYEVKQDEELEAPTSFDESRLIDNSDMDE